MYGQTKKDGIFCYSVVDKDGCERGFSRTGLELTNFDPRYHGTNQHKPGVYINELTCRHCSLEELSGLFNPMRVKPLDKAQEELVRCTLPWFHDYLTLDGFIQGKVSTTYLDRYKELKERLDSSMILGLTSIMDENDKDIFTKLQVDLYGEEGAVYKHDAGWIAGHKGWKCMV